jgi:DNA polymerase-3 subunit epsilon
MKLKASVIDVETTGLSPRSDVAIELGIVLFEFDAFSGEVFAVLDEYSGLRDPGRPIPPDSIRTHGITDSDVRGLALDNDAVRRLLSRSAMLIAHNARFDRGFVEPLFPETARLPWMCSMDGIPWRDKGFSSKGLQELLAAHGIAPGAAHRALDDARNTLKLISRPGASGRPYLSELLQSRR